MIPYEKRPIELRIFPNEKYGDVGHDSHETRKKFLFGKGKDSLKNRGGAYRVHTVKPVNRVRKGTVALFRFEDSILGEGKISHEVRYLHKENKYYEPGMEGYVVFATDSLYYYPNEPSIDEIWQITGKYPGKRNVWTYFELRYLDAIRKKGGFESQV